MDQHQVILEEQSFVYADIVYDAQTKQYGYAMALIQQDQSYDVGSVRYGFGTIEEARQAAFLDYSNLNTRRTFYPTLRRWKWKLWIGWVVLSGAAYLLAALLLDRVVAFRATLETGQGISYDPMGTQVYLAVAAIQGLIIGIAQWLVVRRAFPNVRWPGWVLLSAVGYFLSQFALAVMSYLVAITPTYTNDLLEVLRPVTGVALGLIVIGTGQWIVLRRHCRHAGWWIVASAAAGIITGVAQEIVYRVLPVPDLGSDTLFYIYFYGIALPSSIGAVVTGLALVLLSRYAPKETKSVSKVSQPVVEV